jgi:hypothetical protein
MTPGQWHDCRDRPVSIPYDSSKSIAKKATPKRPREDSPGPIQEGAEHLSKAARKALRKVSVLIAEQPALSAFLASNHH